MSELIASGAARYFPASEIAKVWPKQISKSTLVRIAEREHWPKIPQGNRFEYQPPAEIAVLLSSPSQGEDQGEGSLVKFTDVAHSESATRKANMRLQAIELYKADLHLGIELALVNTVKTFREIVDEQEEKFSISVSSLRNWIKRFEQHGLNGLVDQCQGNSGRKGCFVPDHIRSLGKAMVAEYGSVARAARQLALHPELPNGMRMQLHDGHASKSYVSPSIREAIQIAPLTKKVLQGPRAARLAGRWTPGDYSNVRAGDVFVSDDMTSNVLCWCEWPNANGWRIGQAQILPVMDVGSLRWLNVRVIMREGGQYNAHDDIWGLFGDTFEKYGLPQDGFLLEGGHWQSNAVIGHRTGIENETRIGGLASLGLKVHRSYDPRSKGMLEGAFNQLQHVMDRMPGYAGRDQRTQLPEVLKKQIALLQVKNPQHHPREFLPHVSQLADQVQTAMENLNHERNDGKILRGMSPLEKWGLDNPGKREIPDTAKWLYRSAMSIVKVTANGARITRGSGFKQDIYYYDAPELLVPRQGRKIKVYWNDGTPEADAIFCEIDGKFIGVGKYVQPLQRFGATDEQLAAEAKRKSAGNRYARTEARSMQEHLVRRTVPIPVDQAGIDMGARIRAAQEAAAQKQVVQKRTNRLVAQTEVNVEDIAAAISTERSAATANRSEQFSSEEISHLFSSAND